MVLAIVLCAVCALIAIDIAGSRMMNSALPYYIGILAESDDEREVYRIRDENPNAYMLAYMIVRLRNYPDPKMPIWHPPEGKERASHPHVADSTFLMR